MSRYRGSVKRARAAVAPLICLSGFFGTGVARRGPAKISIFALSGGEKGMREFLVRLFLAQGYARARVCTCIQGGERGCKGFLRGRGESASAPMLISIAMMNYLSGA